MWIIPNQSNKERQKDSIFYQGIQLFKRFQQLISDITLDIQGTISRSLEFGRSYREDTCLLSTTITSRNLVNLVNLVKYEFVQVIFIHLVNHVQVQLMNAKLEALANVPDSTNKTVWLVTTVMLVNISFIS